MRPVKMLTYVAPAFAARIAWLKDRMAVQLTATSSRTRVLMTSRQDRPSSVMTGIFTTTFRAQSANTRACSTISFGSLVVTSTLTGRSLRSLQRRRAPSSMSNTPSLSMMLGLVVTPSMTPCRSHCSISLKLAESIKICIPGSSLEGLTCDLCYLLAGLWLGHGGHGFESIARVEQSSVIPYAHSFIAIGD